MKAPDLNRMLVLESPVKVPDDAGGYARSWEVLGTLWVAMKAGAGRELAASSATISRVPYQIILRAAPFGAPSRPVAGQRFREGSRVFHINAVAEVGGNGRYLTCFAEEEVAS